MSIIALYYTGVMLTVMLPPENVTEPRNSTQLITVRACFTTFIDQPLDREVAFEFVMSPLTTATFGVDFLPVLDSTFLIIPRNFSGFFDQCVPIEIYGDDEVEGTEVIAYDLVPLSDLDSVVFPPGRNLTLRIMDRVGKYTVCLSESHRRRKIILSIGATLRMALPPSMQCSKLLYSRCPFSGIYK